VPCRPETGSVFTISSISFRRNPDRARIPLIPPTSPIPAAELIWRLRRLSAAQAGHVLDEAESMLVPVPEDAPLRGPGDKVFLQPDPDSAIVMSAEASEEVGDTVDA
jgi:hypothetical protein